MMCASASACDHRIHDLHRMLAFELRIGLHRIIRHQRIVLQRLIGPRQSHRIHAQVDNLLHDGAQRSVVEAADHKFLLVESVPVTEVSRTLRAGRIENLMTAGMKRRHSLRIAPQPAVERRTQRTSAAAHEEIALRFMPHSIRWRSALSARQTNGNAASLMHWQNNLPPRHIGMRPADDVRRDQDQQRGHVQVLRVVSRRAQPRQFADARYPDDRSWSPASTGC